jgi:hypothetical protein
MEAQKQEPRAERARYQIKIQGRLDDGWLDFFNGLAMTFEDDLTLLTGFIVDQSKLRGILSKIWDLNLQVVSVARIEQLEDSEKRNEEVNNG